MLRHGVKTVAHGSVAETLAAGGLQGKESGLTARS